MMISGHKGLVVCGRKSGMPPMECGGRGPKYIFKKVGHGYSMVFQAHGLRSFEYVPMVTKNGLDSNHEVAIRGIEPPSLVV